MAEVLGTLTCALVLVAATTLGLRAHQRAAWRSCDLSRWELAAELLPFLGAFRRRLAQAEALFWRGRFDDSLALLARDSRAAHRRDPSRRHAIVAALDLVSLDRVERARELLAAVQRDAPRSVIVPVHEVRRRFAGDPAEQALRGLLAFADGATEAARAHFERTLVDPQPFARLGHYVLARLAMERGDTTAARLHLEAAIEGGRDLFVVDRAIDTYRALFPLRTPPARHVESSTLRTELGDLALSLACGFRLGTLRRVQTDRIPATVEQLALVATTTVMLTLLRPLLEYRPGSHFMATGLFGILAWWAALLPLAYLVGKIVGQRGATLRIAVLALSAAPWVCLARQLLDTTVDGPGPQFWIRLLLGVWSAAILARVVILPGPRRRILRAAACAALYLGVGVVPFLRARPATVWYHPSPDVDAYLARIQHTPVTLENQPTKLRATQTLLAQRPGVTDLYFVGFAGWGEQDVFANEVGSFRAMLDKRFDTRDRSIMLVNDDRAPDDTAVASSANLDATLRYVGSVMDREDDVLFLWITSHGSASTVAVRVLDARLTSITPAALRDALDASAIKWRVLVVSACESGGFVAPLSNPNTLVATASAADRNSFGCGSGRGFTEYGNAVYLRL